MTSGKDDFGNTSSAMQATSNGTWYIHYNPVKHGYVRAVAEWPFSSFHRHVRDGIYPADWAGSEVVKATDME